MFNFTTSSLAKVTTYIVVFLFLFSFISFSGCGNVVEEPKVQLDFEYDPFTIKSLEEASIYLGAAEHTAASLSQIERFALDRLADKITFSTLERYGKNYRQRISQDYEIIEDEQQVILQEILENLIAVFDDAGVEHPDWQVHVVRSKDYSEVNAFTDGYNITFTEGIIKLCEGDKSRLAGILGHEMFHSYNEDLHCQHYRHTLFKECLGDRFGTIVGRFYDRNIASAVGQSRETLADIQSLPLIYAAGYDPYEAIKVDYLLAEQSPGNRGFSSLIATHPPSDARLAALSTVLEIARIRAEEKSE